MTDIIKALERFANVTLTADGQIVGLMREDFELARTALATYRASVDAVELPEPEFYYRPVCGGEMYEGPHHARSVGGRMMREEKPGEWFGLHHESTVRRLIAEAVAREREECAKACDVKADEYSGGVREIGDRSHGKHVAAATCAAAIRARGGE